MHARLPEQPAAVLVLSVLTLLLCAVVYYLVYYLSKHGITGVFMSGQAVRGTKRVPMCHADGTSMCAEVVPAGAPVLLITDIGADIDDTQALLALLGLPALRLVGLVTSVGDGVARAALARGWMRLLGVGDAVPVAPSVDKLVKVCVVPEDDRFPSPADAVLRPLGDAPKLILELAAEYPGELLIIGIAPLTPLADALRLDEAGVLLTTRRLYLQGNCTVDEADKTTLRADPMAYNFRQDMDAANFVFERLQGKVPFSLLGKHAAYRVGVTQAELRTLSRKGLPSVLDSAQEQMAKFRLELPAVFDKLYPIPAEKRDCEEWLDFLPDDVISKPYDPLLVLVAAEDAKESLRASDKATGPAAKRACVEVEATARCLFTRDQVGAQDELVGNSEARLGGVPDPLAVKNALLAAMTRAIERAKN